MEKSGIQFVGALFYNALAPTNALAPYHTSQGDTRALFYNAPTNVHPQVATPHKTLCLDQQHFRPTHARRDGSQSL